MKRISVFLTDPQLDTLHAYVEHTDLKLSEVLRRIVDEWIQRLPKDAPPSQQEAAP